MARRWTLAARVSQIALRVALVGFLAYLAVVLWPLRGALTEARGSLASVKSTSETVRRKVAAIEVAPLNESAHYLQQATANVQAITDSVNLALPRLHKGLFYLWKHADRTLGHFDAASKAEMEQQKSIAAATTKAFAQTTQTMRDVDQAVVESNVPLIASHIASATDHVDQMAAHGEHIAEHYDRAITAPKKWWQKLKDAVIAGAIWGARHL